MRTGTTSPLLPRRSPQGRSERQRPDGRVPSDCAFLRLLFWVCVSCSRHPEPRSESSARGDSNASQEESAAAASNATEGGSTDAGRQPGAREGANGIRSRNRERAGENSYFLLEVIGPAAAFRARAATPTDPEVFYLEESMNDLGDGRRAATAVAKSKAAVNRFKATARKLGFEVRP